MNKYPPSISNLIAQFSKLPGLGPKSAERLVFYLLKQPPEELKKLASDIENLKKSIKVCQICYNYSLQNPCEICRNAKRDHATLCLVALPQDLAVIENTGEYQGVYHVLGGVLNAVEGVTPDKLKIKELLNRIKGSKIKIKEVILALNPDLEGESTTLYLTRQLKPFKVKITRLAKGLPTGADLEYADAITVTDALKGRREV